MAGEEIPKGFARIVVVAITNEERSSFYLQKKDNSYPLEEGRLSYTFFGGHVEPGESIDDAFNNEMFEEFDKDIAKSILARRKEVFVFSCELPLKREIHLSEAVFSDSELEYIARQKVKEGEGGFVIKKENIGDIKMMPAIRVVMNKYLDQTSKAQPQPQQSLKA